jgi:uncharacterized protein YegP (UPF0339 family)
MRSGIVLLIPIALLAGLIPQVLAAPSAAPLLVQAPTRQEPKVSGRGLKFETYTDAKGEYRWRLKSSNGQVIATSGQGYKDKRDCENAIDVIKRGAQGAKVEESKAAEGS